MAEPEQDAMGDLIRRADAYAHTEYYGQGLIDCLADNRRLAEEAKAAVLAEAAGVADPLLPVIRDALERLPDVCRYHGAEVEATGGGWMSRRESCCDTGLPALLRRRAMDALERMEAGRG